MSLAKKILQKSAWSLRARFIGAEGIEPISLEKLEELSQMAYINLPKDEAEKKDLQKDISNIMYFTKMVRNSADPLKAASIYSVDLANSHENSSIPLREDRVTEGGDAEAILKNATLTQSGYFVSEKTVET
eukprot:CAMPEP_0184035398 /NCGR_PEP_ID=MMETSP0955-20130417/25758_1 /TAXON_ID=627963 /ORGANISM="Aplanochytrium sp, Strain PBS07" /LENGTH=130 /DNA_ID=CAMNT_0026322527 /DNA_START=150 /DNA_END=542 /DNA_ORIENTATION=+